MPVFDPVRAQRFKDAIEAALRDGWHPPTSSGGKGSATAQAARRLTEAGFKVSVRDIQAYLQTQANRRKVGKEHFTPDWHLFARPGLAPSEAATGAVQRWILTAAQDDTDVHPRFWSNLQAFANVLGAQIIIAGFTYQTVRHTDRMTLTKTYRREIRDFLRFDPIDCGRVRFDASMNTLPTAARPLSGVQTMSQGRDTVFPHAKQHLECVPQMPPQVPAAVMTTGAVTVPNYIEKKAGQKAKFHHTLGAVLVEVDGAGRHYCRQISATPDGAFQDLDTVVSEGRIRRGQRAEAVVFGDLHWPYVAPEQIEALWGAQAGSMLEALRPSFQVIHDLLDMRMYSRWTRGDAHHAAELHHAGERSVAETLVGAARFLEDSRRDWCRTVVVSSNHDRRLVAFAKDKANAADPLNRRIWLELNLMQEIAAEEGRPIDLVGEALRRASADGLEGVTLLPFGESFQVCQDRLSDEIGNGIELGLHFDVGPNGVKGSPSSLARAGRRMVGGDKHQPFILDGVVGAGISCEPDQGYNKGLSSWRHAHAVIYPNGKRALVMQADDFSWRAS